MIDQLEPYFEGIVYPLRFRFRHWTFAPRMDVIDAKGRSIIHARQKLFRFREHVEIFTDDRQQTKLGDIRADQIIDWSARYSFTDAWDEAIGSVGRKGWRSLWRAHYEVFNPGDRDPDFAIREENPIAKVIDGIVGEIPLLGMISLWLFHPKYLATGASGVPTMRLTKQPAFFQGRFRVDQLAEVTPRETLNLLLAFMMLTLLERKRG
jgi:hypothetical protein